MVSRMKLSKGFGIFTRSLFAFAVANLFVMVLWSFAILIFGESQGEGIGLAYFVFTMVTLLVSVICAAGRVVLSPNFYRNLIRWIKTGDDM